MELLAQTYWLPKEGNTPEEYEDAFATSKRGFAIADGASESTYADAWAQSLVRSFVGSTPRLTVSDVEAWNDWLRPLQIEWNDRIPWDRLPWYAEEKARNGAFAAFVGLRFQEDGVDPVKKGFWRRLRVRKRKPVPRWNAIAVGDCCLFHIRDKNIATSFPLTLAEQFSSRPVLISSLPVQNETAFAGMRLAEGDYKADDLFLMASDALAHWILSSGPDQPPNWTKLANLKNQDEFAALIGQLRGGGALRNDDTTLVMCRWHEEVKS